MGIRAVISDFDGTILAPQGIPSSFWSAKKTLENAGIPVYVATGRPVESLISTLSAYSGDLKPYPGVFCDGSVLKDRDNQSILLSTFDLEVCSVIYEYLRLLKKAGIRINIGIQGLSQFYSDTTDLDIGRREQLVYNSLTVVDSVDEIRKRYNDQILAFAISSDSADALVCVQQLVRTAFPRCPAFVGGTSNVLILSNGCTKAQGVRALCNLLKYKEAEVLVIGDGDNDLEMLAQFPHSIAMGNASPEVRKAAKVVAPNVDDDGWALSVLQYIAAADERTTVASSSVSDDEPTVTI
ncbi:putative haloacid dehalogenase-like hydrolase [Gregarina niphandrodes]|uniref:Haloacid dehalogenase-like hydrolase n=1 Tax=Gregarina niphandrodes TaxID=110365 RepID=A0A023B239_GRENI|nr:putative haloacid dehalogenase-like hydrolase [Gregarina niphandrodes]EZG48227.1 putative haloacid dehalogenase-like hydrolase [Gregarina niphandrodes]|eukprot:XP_011132123.1 putative haloacid dehalogenase-like hydrolase [Gregarina niphandrodes]